MMTSPDAPARPGDAAQAGWLHRLLNWFGSLFEQPANGGQGRKLARTTYRNLMRIGGQPVPLNVRINPRARRIIVKVNPSTGEVAVIAPSARAINGAIDFARTERAWIAERLARIPPAVPFAAGAVLPYRGVDHVIRWTGASRGTVAIDHDAAQPTIRVAGGLEFLGRRLEDWYKRQARAQLTRKVEFYAGMLGVKVRRITIRDGASRWGSCSSSGSLSFSWRLVMAPPFVLDYVAAHEVAHLREMNHGPRFWRHVEGMIGDTAAAQAWLREHGSGLHRYGDFPAGNPMDVML
jgi:predicted metal-dependent hydrolase